MDHGKAKRILRDAGFELTAWSALRDLLINGKHVCEAGDDSMVEFYEIADWATRLHLKDGKVVPTDYLFRLSRPPEDIDIWYVLRKLHLVR
jgi:hypothetical protein